MSRTTPALSGSESVVGIVREATWGTTPTTGADPDKVITNPVFMPIKTEGINAGFNAQPQTDDMNNDREIARIIQNGSTNTGPLTMNPGPESIGYFLTMLFGTPTTSSLAATSGSYEAVYQHIWYPALNTRSNWPAPYSIESQFANTRSKLIRGALLNKLTLSGPNNAPFTLNADFIAKNIIWLTTASGGTNHLGEVRPAKMTASPVKIDESPWHFKHIKAYPQMDSADLEVLNSIDFDMALNITPLFTGGSGLDIGNYRVDNFQLSGKATVEFETEDRWEKFKNGDYFKLDLTLEGDVIQGAYKNQLQVIAYSCMADSNDLSNKVGSLEYDFAWTAREDPVEGKSCQITLINTVSSYA